MDPTPLEIHTPDIHLDALLKYAGIVSTGGEAKVLILSGRVRVNGTPEGRRGHRVLPGDVIEVFDESEVAVASLAVRTAGG